jgi:hypothetical protein
VNRPGERAKLKAQSTKFKKTNPETNLNRGGLFYTQKELFDSPTTLDYASPVRNVIQAWEGF